MLRREFVTLVTGAAAAWPLAARAQQPERVRRIGVLYSLAEADPESVVRRAALEKGLKELGWINGGNIRIDYRWAKNDPELIRKFAAELIALAPDVRQRRRRSSGAGDPQYSDRLPAGHRPGRLGP